MNGKIMGYWGVQGNSLYFQVDNDQYRKESMVAINISNSRIDWLKINYEENVYIIAKPKST